MFVLVVLAKRRDFKIIETPKMSWSPTSQAWTRWKPRS